MKKYLVLISVIAVLAFSASAFALHEVASQEYTPSVVKSAAKSMIEIGGEIRVRGEFNKNLSDFNNDGKPSDNTQAYDQRVRLNLKATVSPNTFGFIELESCNGSEAIGTTLKVDDNGDPILDDNGENQYTTTKSSPCKTSDGNTWGSNNSKTSDLYIRQAYISTNLGKAATLKAGHMLLALGNNLFFDHTKFGDDALLLSIPAGDGEVTLISIKLAEGTKTQNDDTNAYVAAFATPLGSAKVSADLTYIVGHDKQTYDKGTKLFNLGLRANADAGAVKVKADVEIQRGKDAKSEPDSDGNEETKYKGYAVLLGAEANAGAATVRGNFAYGSGDKEDSDGNTGEKEEGFVTALSDQQYYTYIYDYKVAGASGSKTGGLRNTMYLNVGATAKPTADLKVSGDLYYLRAAKAVAINEATDENGDEEKSKKLGVEIDAKVEYQLDTNLVYYVEAGYLFAGPAYDTPTTVAGDNESSDNPYSIRHGLLLKF